MSTRRGTLLDRCPSCRVNFRFCFCDKITKVPIKTKLQVLIHIRELALTSNTISLTKLSVPEDKIRIQTRGEKDQVIDFSFLEDDKVQYLYLFPSESSQVFNREYLQKISKPMALIIPDGTWRQTLRFHKRERPLQSIPHIKLDMNIPSLYELRKQKFNHGLCTHEAISYALGIIEGDQIEQALLTNLKIMVEANLKARALIS
jgi:DTW domain-containing protein